MGINKKSHQPAQQAPVIIQPVHYKLHYKLHTPSTMKLVYSSVFLGLFATSIFSAPPSCPRTKTTSPRYATANLGNNLDLWLSQSAPKTNTIHSPASIFNILSAAYFGTNAKSETRRELQKKFGFKDDCAADGEVDNYAQKLGYMTRTNALETFNSYIFHKKSLNPAF